MASKGKRRLRRAAGLAAALLGAAAWAPGAGATAGGSIGQNGKDGALSFVAPTALRYDGRIFDLRDRFTGGSFEGYRYYPRVKRSDIRSDSIAITVLRENQADDEQALREFLRQLQSGYGKDVYDNTDINPGNPSASMLLGTVFEREGRDGFVSVVSKSYSQRRCGDDVVVSVRSDFESPQSPDQRTLVVNDNDMSRRLLGMWNWSPYCADAEQIARIEAARAPKPPVPAVLPVPGAASPSIGDSSRPDASAPASAQASASALESASVPGSALASAPGSGRARLGAEPSDHAEAGSALPEGALAANGKAPRKDLGARAVSQAAAALGEAAQNAFVPAPGPIDPVSRPAASSGVGSDPAPSFSARTAAPDVLGAKVAAPGPGLAGPAGRPVVVASGLGARGVQGAPQRPNPIQEAAPPAPHEGGKFEGRRWGALEARAGSVARFAAQNRPADPNRGTAPAPRIDGANAAARLAAASPVSRSRLGAPQGQGLGHPAPRVGSAPRFARSSVSAPAPAPVSSLARVSVPTPAPAPAAAAPALAQGSSEPSRASYIPVPASGSNPNAPHVYRVVRGAGAPLADAVPPPRPAADSTQVAASGPTLPAARPPAHSGRYSAGPNSYAVDYAGLPVGAWRSDRR